MTDRGLVLETARSLVIGNRDQQYGNPRGSFAEIALRWNHYLSGVTGMQIGITEHDVAMMMAEFKLARIMTSKGKSEDSYIDACGYLAIAAELYEDEVSIVKGE